MTTADEKDAIVNLLREHKEASMNHAQRGDIVQYTDELEAEHKTSPDGVLVLSSGRDGSVTIEGGYTLNPDQYTIVKRANYADPDVTMVPATTTSQPIFAKVLRAYETVDFTETECPIKLTITLKSGAHVKALAVREVSQDGTMALLEANHTYGGREIVAIEDIATVYVPGDENAPDHLFE